MPKRGYYQDSPSSQIGRDWSSRLTRWDHTVYTPTRIEGRTEDGLAREAVIRWTVSRQLKEKKSDVGEVEDNDSENEEPCKFDLRRNLAYFPQDKERNLGGAEEVDGWWVVKDIEVGIGCCRCRSWGVSLITLGLARAGGTTLYSLRHTPFEPTCGTLK